MVDMVHQELEALKQPEVLYQEHLELVVQEFLLTAATVEPVAAAGTAVEVLTLMEEETTTAVEVEVLDMFGQVLLHQALQKDTFYHLVNTYQKLKQLLVIQVSQLRLEELKQVTLVMDSLKFPSHYHMILIF